MEGGGAPKRSATEALLHARLYQQSIQPIKRHKSSSSALRAETPGSTVPLHQKPGMPQQRPGAASASGGGLAVSSRPSGAKVRAGSQEPPVVPHTVYRPCTLPPPTTLDGKGGIISDERHARAQERSAKLGGATQTSRGGASATFSQGGYAKATSSTAAAPGDEGRPGGATSGRQGGGRPGGRPGSASRTWQEAMEQVLAQGRGGTPDSLAASSLMGGEEFANAINPRDFVEFIRSHEQLKDEFCYMTRSGPYDFEIIPFSQINPDDYMTISARGVTHFCGGELTFLNLEDWELEQDLHAKLLTIPFFRKYARWKLFSVWKRAIMRIRVKKCSKTLNSNLLTLDDGLRGPLMRIRSRCVDASTWNILEIPLRQTHTLAQFEQMQEEKIAQILQQLKDVWEEIRRELVESCQVSLRLFLEANGFSTEDAKAGAEGTVDASAADGTIVVREEQVKQVSYTERATTRTQCRKLSKFIRTAQFLLNTGIIEMVKHSTLRLLQLLQHFVQKGTEDPTTSDSAPRRKKGDQQQIYPDNTYPTFLVECKQRNGEIVFRPSATKFRNYLEHALFEGLKAVTKAPTFISLPELSMYTETRGGDALSTSAAATTTLAVVEASSSGGGDGNAATAAPPASPSELALLIISDPGFRDLLLSIGKNFDVLFGFVIDYASKYRGFAEMFVENEQLQDPAEQFKDATQDDLVEALEKYKSQQDAMRAIAPLKNLFLFELDSSKLQELLLPSPQRCWDLMSAYIPKLAIEKCRKITSELEVANEKLGATARNVGEYILYSEYLNEFSKSFKAIEDASEVVNNLVGLIRDYKIKLDKSERGAFNEMSNYLTVCQGAIQVGLDRADADVTKFTGELQNLVPTLYEDVANQDHKLKDVMLDDDSLMDTEEGRIQVLQFLKECEEEVTDSAHRAEQYKIYQDRLGLEVTPFENCDDLKMLFSSKAKLWRGVDNWTKQSAQWRETQFIAVDVDAMNKDIQ